MTVRTTTVGHFVLELIAVRVLVAAGAGLISDSEVQAWMGARMAGLAGCRDMRADQWERGGRVLLD